jgi:hypothetical protein
VPVYTLPFRKPLRSAGLAQLVEHLICNQGVTGSSPVPGTNTITKIITNGRATQQMAKKPPSSIDSRPANLTSVQVAQGVRKLERRLKDIQDLDAGNTAKEDFRSLSESASTRVNATLLEVFGPNTIEMHRAEMHPANFQPGVYFGSMDRSDHADAFERGRKIAIGRLESELAILREKIEDTSAEESSASIALRAYEGLELHQDISEAASELFRNEHYANAIEDSVKALNALVRYRSKLDLDGSSLMETAFSPKKPVLRFNELADQSGLHPVLKTPRLVFLWNQEVGDGETEIHARVQA